MPKLYSSRDIVKVIEKFDFNFISQKGSHAKYKNAEGRTIIVPMAKREIPVGTFKSIIKQSGINSKEFMQNIGK